MIDKIKQIIIDIYFRILNKQKCILFSNKYISLETIDQYKKIFENNYKLAKFDNKGKVIFANKHFCEKYNIDESELMNKNVSFLNHSVTSDKYNTIQEVLGAKRKWEGSINFEDKEGNEKYNKVSIFPIKDKKENIKEFIYMGSDLTEMVKLEKEILESQKEIIFTLGAVVEGKDDELKEHVKKVSKYAYILAKAYGLSEKDSAYLEAATSLHDIGKIGIPEEILNAPRKLSKEEFEIIKTHPTIGYNIFKESNLKLLQLCGKIAYEHHEKWNGQGYPRGIKGEEISIEGRIVSLADVFEALSANRAYKKPWPLEKIENYFREEKGVSFDPKIVDLYFENREKFLKILKNT